MSHFTGFLLLVHSSHKAQSVALLPTKLKPVLHFVLFLTIPLIREPRFRAITIREDISADKRCTHNSTAICSIIKELVKRNFPLKNKRKGGQ